MSKYLEEYPDNSLARPLDVCMDGIKALGRPKRIGALEVAQRSILPTALGVEKYDLDKTPYLRQVLEDLNLSNRGWTKVALVAPQRSGKSQIGEFLLGSGIENNVDSLVMFGTQSLARDGSNQGFRRLIQNNPSLKNLMLGGHGNSVFTQKSKAGAFITYLWPSESNIRQRTATITWANDADMFGEIEGKGDVIGLLHARGQTKKSRAMHFIESAPYAPIDIDHDEAKPLAEMDLFEAYPSQGVAGLWMQGTRFKWFWRCEGCDEHFHAGPENFHVDLECPPREAAQKAAVICPHCGQIYNKPVEKYRMNLAGSWFGPGMVPVEDIGDNQIRSYWLYGPAAGFMSWAELAYDLASSWEKANSTGDKSSLQRAYTSSMCLQWVDPDASKEDPLKNLEDRAEKDLDRRIVPDDAHFLVTTIDQQKRRFVVQVHAFGRGAENWLVDRYNVLHSPSRTADDGKPSTIEPSEYSEDWAALKKVIDREYKTKSGAVMKSKIVTCDTGGENHATKNAYDYWNQWRKEASDPTVFRLVKGFPKGERISKSATTEKKSNATLWNLNVNMLKDEAFYALGRLEAGPRCVHFPDWLGQWFYDELRAEVKDPKKGTWSKKKEKLNNEAFDLLGYSFAAYTMAGGEHIDYDNPPNWAKRAGDRKDDGSKADDLDWLKGMAKRLNR